MRNIVTNLFHSFRLHSAAKNDAFVEKYATLFERTLVNFKDTCTDLQQQSYDDSFALYDTIGGLSRLLNDPDDALTLIRLIAKIDPEAIEVVGNPNNTIAPLLIDRARILSEKYDDLPTSPKNIQDLARPLLPSPAEIMDCLQRAIGNTAASRLRDNAQALVH